MKTLKKFLVGIIAIIFTFSITGSISVLAATSPTLTDSINYSVLGFSTVTNTGLTTLSGDLGLYSGTSITGFFGTTANEGPGTVAGTVHQTDGPGVGTAQNAQVDNVAAFSTLNQGCDNTYADGQDLTLLSPLGPGVYCSLGSFALSGNLNLTGSGVWIFKSATTLTTAPGSSITGGDPCNVWWRVGSSATLGTTTHFIGNILALSSITMNTGATLNGRAMAQTGAVTLDTNTISGPICSAPSTTAQLTLIKSVINNNTGSKTAADFSLTATGSTIITGVSGTAAVTNKTVNAGVYTLSEVNQTGYTEGLWTCTNGIVVNGSKQITLVAGDTTTCTIINDDVYTPQGGAGIVVPPLIDVVKVPSPLALPNGPGLVTYTYTLRNTGTVPVSNITMVDDSCSPLALTSGDTNADSKLDLTESWIYKCSTTLSKTRTNIITATGWSNGISAIDTASATVVVGVPIVPPLIHVTKIPNPLSLLSSGTVTYTYTVTNPGTVPLGNVNIIDDKCTGLPGRVIGHPGDLNRNDLLESNEIWSFTCKSNLTKTTTNTATASGSANGLTAKDFAIATVVVANTVPLLPKTGFPSVPWNIVLLSSVLGLASISSVLILRKYLV